ncbi:WD40 repeat domain-containing protein, partial [Actinocorallia longicatena]|uniref:WD40 repeat domain-containing protein n=1 Tax=Actinocorallia longicatena TaxID=111803 RepID=UPI003CD0A09C
PRLAGLVAVAACAALALWAASLVDPGPADRSRATLPVRDVTALSYSPDGRVLALTTRRGGTRPWDLADGHWAAPEPGPSPRPLEAGLPALRDLTSAAPAPGAAVLGSTPATTGRSGVPGARPRGGQGLMPGPDPRDGAPGTAAADRAGRFAVVRSGGFLVLRDGWRAETHRMPLPKTRSLRLDALVFASDGLTIASAGDRARQWNPLTHRMLPGSFPLGGDPVVAFAAGPDRTTLAVATARNGHRSSALTFWSVAAKRPLGPARTLRTRTPLLAYSPSSDTVAVVSGDGIVRFFDAAADRGVGRPLPGHDGTIRALSFSPDGRTLATSDGRTVKLWDVP